MRKTSICILFAFLVAAVFTQYCLADDLAANASLDSYPPSVIKTVPQCGDNNVDPNLGEISVTFSKEMKVTGHCWSWCSESDSTFPALNGDPKFLEDNRTCVLHVKLEPDKTYAIWVNTNKFNSFQDTMGHRAVPYLLVFKTGTIK